MSSEAEFRQRFDSHWGGRITAAVKARIAYVVRRHRKAVGFTGVQEYDVEYLGDVNGLPHEGSVNFAGHRAKVGGLLTGWTRFK